MKSYALDWSPRQPSGSMVLVNGLGLIEIYQDKPQHGGGWAVDINGKRAWSLHRGPLAAVENRINADVHTWNYLNSFAKEQSQ